MREKQNKEQRIKWIPTVIRNKLTIDKRNKPGIGTIGKTPMRRVLEIEVADDWLYFIISCKRSHAAKVGSLMPAA